MKLITVDKDKACYFNPKLVESVFIKEHLGGNLAGQQEVIVRCKGFWGAERVSDYSLEQTIEIINQALNKSS